MKPILLVITGGIASGKSTIANHIERALNFRVLKTRDLIMKKRGLPGDDRRALQDAGEEIDERTEGAWIRDVIENMPLEHTIVDSIRDPRQLTHLYQARRYRLIHVHVTAPVGVRKERYESRGTDRVDWSLVDSHELEANIDSNFREQADFVVDSYTNDPEDSAALVYSRLGVTPGDQRRLVDVVVGAQYGSEGKGHVVSYLASDYDALVRVGGPNAGHTVLFEGSPFCFHHLPSGSFHSPDSSIVLGPGTVINPDMLLSEIERATERDPSLPSRLHIDPHAMLITAEDIVLEGGLVNSVGSTRQGVGAATARRVFAGRRDEQNRSLIADDPRFERYMTDTVGLLQAHFMRGRRVMLEGTQGTGLSLHHGPYPFVTSRDTTAAGCMAEAGIPPGRIRSVYLITRTNPIRVAGNSGPMRNEQTWENISMHAGVSADILRERERTSTTKRLRRVGKFDWTLFARSCALNAPTDIALTFADYMSPRNQDARRYDQLTPPTRALIEEIERVSGCPVSLVSTRFHERSIIDRRPIR